MSDVKNPTFPEIERLKQINHNNPQELQRLHEAAKLARAAAKQGREFNKIRAERTEFCNYHAVGALQTFIF